VRIYTAPGDPQSNQAHLDDRRVVVTIHARADPAVLLVLGLFGVTLGLM
jgi:hypothetical protein